LHHTLPTAVSYRLPVVGQPVENVFLELTVDTAAASRREGNPLRLTMITGKLT
jgi:hypothetical protein